MPVAPAHRLNETPRSSLSVGCAYTRVGAASDEPIDPALVKRGGELAAGLRCGSCHLPTLAGQEQMPRLAKQRVDYMIYALKAFRDDKRSGADTLMTSVVLGKSDADLAALAHYAASR